MRRLHTSFLCILIIVSTYLGLLPQVSFADDYPHCDLFGAADEGFDQSIDSIAASDLVPDTEVAPSDTSLGNMEGANTDCCSDGLLEKAETSQDNSGEASIGPEGPSLGTTNDLKAEQTVQDISESTSESQTPLLSSESIGEKQVCDKLSVSCDIELCDNKTSYVKDDLGAVDVSDLAAAHRGDLADGTYTLRVSNSSSAVRPPPARVPTSTCGRASRPGTTSSGSSPTTTPASSS